MIIVSDTAPLRYLIDIGESDILERLFTRILIPQAVFDEMQRPQTPQNVKDWLNNPPLGWKFDKQTFRCICRRNTLAQVNVKRLRWQSS